MTPLISCLVRKRTVIPFQAREGKRRISEAKEEELLLGLINQIFTGMKFKLTCLEMLTPVSLSLIVRMSIKINLILNLTVNQIAKVNNQVGVLV